MNAWPKQLAIVPAYNEAATIASVIERLRAHAPQFDIVVVDDGSTDATAAIAQNAGVPVLRLPFNVGIGGTVQAGFKYALDEGYEYAVQVDGDGQHEPAHISRLQDVMAADPSIDVAVGSRFLTSDHQYPAPISRRTGIHIFATVCSWIVGQRISDPTSGFRLCNRRAIALFARDYPHDYPEVEAVLMLHWHRLKMREVPVQMHLRGGGESSLHGSGKSAYYMIKVLLAIFVGLLRQHQVIEPGDEAAVAAV